MPVIHHVVPHVPVYVSVHVVILALGAHPTVIMSALDAVLVPVIALNTVGHLVRIHALVHATLVAVVDAVDVLANAKVDVLPIAMPLVVVDALKVALALVKEERVELPHAPTALAGR